MLRATQAILFSPKPISSHIENCLLFPCWISNHWILLCLTSSGAHYRKLYEGSHAKRMNERTLTRTKRPKLLFYPVLLYVFFINIVWLYSSTSQPLRSDHLWVGGCGCVPEWGFKGILQIAICAKMPLDLSTSQRILNNYGLKLNRCFTENFPVL